MINYLISNNHETYNTYHDHAMTYRKYIDHHHDKELPNIIEITVQNKIMQYNIYSHFSIERSMFASVTTYVYKQTARSVYHKKFYVIESFRDSVHIYKKINRNFSFQQWNDRNASSQKYMVLIKLLQTFLGVCCDTLMYELRKTNWFQKVIVLNF